MTTRLGEEPADDIFRADALRLGYLPEDQHAPGDGRGLWAYYRDHDMIAPEVLRKLPEIPVSHLPDRSTFGITRQRFGLSSPEERS